MPPGAAPPNMKMSDSPLIKGAKALGPLGVVLLASGRAGSRDNPLKPSASFPLYKGGFSGEILSRVIKVAIR